MRLLVIRKLLLYGFDDIELARGSWDFYLLHFYYLPLLLLPVGLDLVLWRLDDIVSIQHALRQLHWTSGMTQVI